jgi:hypothetical protein
MDRLIWSPPEFPAAHLPTRKMSDADIQFAKEHNIFHHHSGVTESFARTRLNSSAF